MSIREIMAFTMKITEVTPIIHWNKCSVLIMSTPHLFWNIPADLIHAYSSFTVEYTRI